MKKRIIRIGVALTVAMSLTGTSCIGSFALTNKLLNWNRGIDNKIVNELVFFAFWILPVYEISSMADVLVINSIEFWSGTNPVACGRTLIIGSDGTRYLVECDGKGYTITGENDGISMRLDWAQDTRTWSVSLADGTSHELMTYVDDTHVSMPVNGGGNVTVELSDAGLLAYRNTLASAIFAAR